MRAMFNHLSRAYPLPFFNMAALTLSLAMATYAQSASATPTGITAFTTPSANTQASPYQVGVGIYDVTGAVAETGYFGYVANQDMQGLQQRLYAHAYIIADAHDNKRIVYVSVDTASIFPSIKTAVLDNLKARFGDKYTDANVMLTGTHTHVGNSGFSQDMLYQIAGNDAMGYGWDKANFQAMVTGITNAIIQADARMTPANLRLAKDDLIGATRNRSLAGYQANLDKGQYSRDVDTLMSQLNITDATGKPMGLVNWFATHPTQFSAGFRRLSGDTKGYGQYFFEKAMNSSPANPTFVAAFSNSNTGDVVSSQGNSLSNIAFKGSDNEYLNAEIDGRRQFDKAMSLWQSQGTPLSGSVDYRQRWITWGTNYVVSAKYTGSTDKYLCSPARGWSFASGGENYQTNIPGIYEGMTNTQPFDRSDAAGVLVQLGLGAFSGLLGGGEDPCQGAKPVLLADGKLGWAPTKIPVQLMRVGQLAIVGFPGEITTMAGRRLRNELAKELAPLGVTDIIIASQANAYNAYTTTPEEFATQQYEGASTEFGPYQLAAFTQEFSGLAAAMREGQTVTSTTTPPVLQSLDYKPSRPAVVFDDKPLNQTWGQVLTEPKDSYQVGETAVAVYRGAHPKNNFRTMGTFLKVQRLENGQWVDYLDDHDWDTTYTWEREGAAYSRTTVEWRIRQGTPKGTYRLVQLGDWKNGWTGAVTPYIGESKPFTVG